MNPLKPWYLYRPSQLIHRALRRATPGVRPVPLPWGGALEVDTGKNVGRSLWEAGVYDIAASEVIARLVRPGDLAADVGANAGYMSLLMAWRAGPSGRVVAFEPHPGLARLLRSNAGRADPATSAPIEAREEAVGAAPGRATLVVPPGFEANDGLSYLADAPADGAGAIDVPVAALDDVLAGRGVGVLKLDVEGRELAALEGAARSLGARSIRHVVFEEHGGPSSPACDFLRGRGYALREIGWSLRGPELAALGGPPITRPYEPPNYLATCDLDDALARCRPRGWRVLGRP